MVSKENDTDELRKQLRRYAEAARKDGALVVAQLTNVRFLGFAYRNETLRLDDRLPLLLILVRSRLQMSSF